MQLGCVPPDFYLHSHEIVLFRVVIELGYILEHLGMGEALVIDYIRLARHAEVFYRDYRQLLFADFSQAHALCKDRYAEVLLHKVFYRRDIIDFENNIEVVYRLVVALERRFKQHSRCRSRKTQDEPLAAQLVQRYHRVLCERIVVRHDANEIVRIYHDGIERRIRHFSVRYCKIDLKIVEHIIKIFYSICKNSNAYIWIFVAVTGENLGCKRAFGGVGQTYAQLLYVALGVRYLHVHLLIHRSQNTRIANRNLPFLRQCQLAFLAIEQLRAEGLFELAYLMADRRLGQRESFSRPCEIFLLRNCYQSFGFIV